MAVTAGKVGIGLALGVLTGREPGRGNQVTRERAMLVAWQAAPYSFLFSPC